RIVPENVSVAAKAADEEMHAGFAEEIIPFTEDKAIAEAFADSGYVGEDAKGMTEAIGKLLNAGTLRTGTVLRVGIETDGEKSEIVRTSVYDHASHILTIARDDRHQLVPADEPETSPDVAAAFDDS